MKTTRKYIATFLIILTAVLMSFSRGAFAQAGSIDLSITSMTALPNPVNNGSNVTFTITINSSGNATNVIVTNVLPKDFIFVSSVPVSTNNKGTIQCSIPSLSGSTTVSIIAKPTLTGALPTTVKNVAGVIADQFDPTMANNSAIASITVNSGGSGSPNPPSNLTAIAVSDTQINLSWTDNSNDETGFQVFFWVQGMPPAPLPDLPANTTSYAHTGRTPGTTYWYTVRAIKAGFPPSAEAGPASATALTNNAIFISQVVPTTMVAGLQYNVSVTMKNTGTSTWTAANVYRLGSQNPENNLNWGLGRVELTTSVAPTITHTFNFTVTAPSTPGTYNFQWKMLHEMVQWFGAATTNVAVVVQAFGGGSATPINVALASNGGVVTASSTINSSYPPAAANNGDRKGLNWGNGGGWNDGTPGVFPDWIQVDFNGTKIINEIDVFTLQDNFSNPAEPTPTMTFTLYGITAFDAQYWNGTAWVTVPSGSVTGNNLVWRRFTFSNIATNKIRVLINNALNASSRVVEVEAYSPINVALGSNGGVVTASTTFNSNYPTASVNNGDRKGLNWSNGGGWNDATSGAFPDWIQVDFNGTKTINEIDVFTLQDNYSNPADPTSTMTFSLYGITAFNVEYWNGSAWVTVPGGNITGNNLVWRRFTFSNIATNKIRVTINNALNFHSRVVEVEAYSPVNVALASNGGVASASSTINSSYPAAAANNGDRKGLNWGAGGGWNDGTNNVFPDWIQVDFNGTKTINEIDVFTLQDNFSNPIDPTPTLTFTLYGITVFNVQYWNGSAWVTVPGGAITGNNLVWRRLTFSNISTSKIRVLINNALSYYSRVVELEAYSQ